MKAQLSSGTSIIAFIQVFPDKSYLHYVPITGFDDEYIYIAESLDFLVNYENTSYNRKVPIDEFMDLWDTWVPFYKYTYIAINK